LDGQRLPIRSAPPTLGEGTRAVLQELLAMSDNQLEVLQAAGVLTLPKA
jgi:crotonobetainyl-CoA:carnitine CoA-transferase CaiB-like acyl-CoA transferase